MEPERDLLAGTGLSRGFYGAGEPPLANAAAARASRCGWTGRAFCRDRPRRCTTRDMDCGHMDCGRIVLPNRASIKRQGSGSVQFDSSPHPAPGPARAGRGRRARPARPR